MLGWLADFFRLVWGLLYWNTRKSWFQLRRGRARCPCQSPSDSGRALETNCEACIQWDQPARFRRVCPLLVQTSYGLRCSANTADVRPFWGRAFGYYGGALLSIYLTAAIGVFVFLRAVGYPVSILHITWPGLWYRVPQTQGWFFFERSNRAFAEGKTKEGLMYLANSYEFDPSNYAVGLTLAKNYQTGNPHSSDQIFLKLAQDHPAERNSTLWEWSRALLARGDFDRIAILARDQTLADPAHAYAWIRALLFATKQTGDDASLRALLANDSAAARPWHQLLETELLIRTGQTAAARTALVQSWPEDAPLFTYYYRASALTALGQTFDALDILGRSSGRLDYEATITLTLDAYAAAGTTRLLRREIDGLLVQRLNLPVIKILCAHLIRWPNPEIFALLHEAVVRDQIAMNTETAGIWFSLMCTAGVVGDQTQLHAIASLLKQASNTPFFALNAVEAFFRGETAIRRITTLLPVLPVPLEIDYALIERYPGPLRVPPADLSGPR
mgnify:CR=1 FL=1